MGPIFRKPPSKDYYCLFRSDKEVTTDHRQIADVLRATDRSVEIGDWLDETRNFVLILDENLGRITRRAPRATWFLQRALLELRRRYALQRLSYGIDLLSKGSTVVTDRLHAHILCCLLDIPHFIFDSSMGKYLLSTKRGRKANANARLIGSPSELQAILAGQRLKV